MKKYLVASLLTVGVLSLVGCEERSYNWDGQYLPQSEIEERMEDTLEDQNSDDDFEVSIYNEGDED